MRTRTRSAPPTKQRAIPTTRPRASGTTGSSTPWRHGACSRSASRRPSTPPSPRPPSASSACNSLGSNLAPGVIRQGPAGARGPAGAAGPTGPAGPAGPSDAFSRFLNGPLAVPGTATTLTSLSIPAAGKYVAWAKAFFTASGLSASGTVSCDLVGGSDTDLSQTFVATGTTFTLTNTVVHEFTAAGTFDYKCAYSGTGTTTANFIKITVIKVNNLTNTG